MSRNKEFLQTQEIMRRVFVNKSNYLKGMFSAQDAFNAVYSPDEDALRINLVADENGNSGFLYWQSPVDTVSDLPITSKTERGETRLVFDDGTGSGAIYWYNGTVWEKVAGGIGGGELEIRDEGVVVSSAAKILNFVGADVVARNESGNVVNIYIPPVNYASNFNTNNGDGDCRISNVTTTTRRISSPTSEGNPFKIGSWFGSEAHTCLTVGSITYSTVNPCSFENNTSVTMEVNIYDGGNVKVKTHLTSAISGNIDVTVDNIRIVVSGWEADGLKFKAVVAVTVSLSSIFPNSGRFSVEIIQHDNGIDYIKNQNDLFYDPNIIAQVISSLGISETAGSVVTDMKSGVEAYSFGSGFTIGLADADNLNAHSFPDNFLEFVGSEYGISSFSVSYNNANLTGWTSLYNQQNVSYSESKQVSQLNYYARTNNARIWARAIDWTSGSWLYSTPQSLIIDTYVDNSTRIYEDFRGEALRLQSNLTSPWDSSSSLLVTDGGNGLQVGEGTYLMYPSLNYSIYNPNSVNQPNYSIAVGERFYYRKFWHTDVSHSNGLFNITGVTESDISNDNVKIEISLDGIDWYNCNEDYVGGALINGSGCRINPDSRTMPYLEFTLGFGKFTTAASSWGIYIRISMPSGSVVKMNKIEITSWL